MTSVSKIQYIYKFEDIVNKYNNTHHRTNKMKPIYVNSSTCIDFDVENNDKDHKFIVGDLARI